MEENWVLVLSTTDDKQCKKARAVLKKAKIKTVVVDKNENNEFIGKLDVFVKMEEIGEARTILKGINIE
jgi:hypothetical protein